MRRTGLLFDKRYLRHDTGPGHPERSGRLEAIQEALEDAGLLRSCAPIAPAPATDAEIRRVHADSYLMRLQRSCEQHLPCIDVPDSAISDESFDVARLAAGGVVAATRAVLKGELERAFCAVRPPGHHCEHDRSMGFCLLNNVAIAARAALAESDVQRVLILDWDVHHGNGTQHAFEADRQVLFVSLHGHPRYLYPGTGYAEETGTGPGAGYTINVPLLPGTRGDEYREAFEARVTPAVEEFQPQLVLISAGFDAHRVDPLGNLQLEDDDFEWLTRTVSAWADRYAAGRIVSVLEGGYDLAALGRCVARHVTLLGE